MTFLQAPTDGNVSLLVPRFNTDDTVRGAQLSTADELPRPVQVSFGSKDTTRLAQGDDCGIALIATSAVLRSDDEPPHFSSSDIDHLVDRGRALGRSGSRRTIADMWYLVGGEGFGGVSMVTKEFESSSVASALTDAMSSVTDTTTRFRPKIGIIVRSSTLNRAVGVVIPANMPRATHIDIGLIGSSIAGLWHGERGAYIARFRSTKPAVAYLKHIFPDDMKSKTKNSLSVAVIQLRPQDPPASVLAKPQAASMRARSSDGESTCVATWTPVQGSFVRQRCLLLRWSVLYHQVEASS